MHEKPCKYVVQSLAPIWRRAIAFFVDFLLFFVPILAALIFLIGNTILRGMGSYSDNELNMYFYTIPVFLFVAVFIMLYFYSRNSVSLGKRLMQIRIVDADGNPPTSRLFRRRISCMVLYSIILYIPGPLIAFLWSELDRKSSQPFSSVALGLGAILIGWAYLSAIRDPYRQAMHDKWAKTFVVRKKNV